MHWGHVAMAGFRLQVCLISGGLPTHLENLDSPIQLWPPCHLHSLKRLGCRNLYPGE
jgi:hypothetical protein